MSLWQFAAYVEGWRKSQGADDVAAPTDAEFDAMIAASEALDARVGG